MIVIGSGISGMTTSALLAKAGKRVLVLEQHDQAGGCCHSFVEKGFEFDSGKGKINFALFEYLSKSRKLIHTVLQVVHTAQ